MRITDGAADGVSIAYCIVTAQQFDYFGSAQTAREHAEAEGISPEDLAIVGSDVTRVPRAYPTGLEANLRGAFDLLNGREPQGFLHIDRYGITAGRTHTSTSHEQAVDFVIPPSGRSCAIRLRACDFVRFSLRPPQLFTKSMDKGLSAPLELPLGKHVLLPGASDEAVTRAMHDSFRDWERVFVVGGSAVGHYINSTLSKLTDNPRSGSLAMSIGLGAMSGEFFQPSEEKPEKLGTPLVRAGGPRTQDKELPRPRV